MQMLSQVINELCTFVFSDPAKDQQLIRAHAALMGKKELLQQLLTDNYPPEEPEEAAPQPSASDDAGNNPGF